MSANTLAAVLAFGRAVVLARLIPVEAFGAYALAISLVTWSGYIGTLGLSGALLHRAPETADEERAAAVHFTLTVALTLAWGAAMVAIATVAADGPLRLALVALTLAACVANLAATPRALLVRRVEHGRLAVVEVLGTLASIAAAVPMAVAGGGLLALVAGDLAIALTSVAVLYLWRPVWRPRIADPRGAARYFLRFGAQATATNLLAVTLVRLDKIWIGLALGQAQLGYYSRAFVFAGYPQQVLLSPVESVARGGFAELAGDRGRLSHAFLRAGAVLTRAACGVAGALALVAPELVALVLGARWLPMVPAFRLLLLGAVLAPLRALLSSLFVAVGRPGLEARAGVVQLAVLATGIAVAGGRLGTAGVAAALVAALAVGAGLMLLWARDHVDLSPGRLAVAPAVAAALALAAGWAAGRGVETGPALLAGTVKAASFAAVYAGVLLALERRWLAELLATARRGGGA